jgi:hypothetical protein
MKQMFFIADTGKNKVEFLAFDTNCLKFIFYELILYI